MTCPSRAAVFGLPEDQRSFATHFGFRSKTIVELRLWTPAAFMDMHRIFLPALVLQIYPAQGWGGDRFVHQFVQQLRCKADQRTSAPAQQEGVLPQMRRAFDRGFQPADTLVFLAGWKPAPRLNSTWRQDSILADFFLSKRQDWNLAATSNPKPRGLGATMDLASFVLQQGQGQSLFAVCPGSQMGFPSHSSSA